MRCLLVKIKLIILAIITTVSISCKSSSTQKIPPTTNESKKVVYVKVVKVKKQDLKQYIRYTGVVVPKVEVRVFSKFAERIVSLNVNEGEFVKRGEIIAVLNSTLLNEGVKQALFSLQAMKTNMTSLEDKLGRLEKLYQSGVVNKADVDSVRYQLDALRANYMQLSAVVNEAKLRKSDSIITAPISGLITNLNVKQGDMALPSIPIASIMEIDEVYGEINVAEEEIKWFKKGSVLPVYIIALEKSVEGRVEFISPSINPLTHTAIVKVLITNREHEIKPGMMINVEVLAQERKGVVVAPVDAFRLEYTDRGLERIGFVLKKDNTVEARRVELGLIVDEIGEVKEGLQEDEYLVVDGQHLLYDGQKVVVESGI